MCCQREPCSLWFWLKFWDNYGGTGKKKWRFPWFVKRKMWKNEFFLQDTFRWFYNV